MSGVLVEFTKFRDKIESKSDKFQEAAELKRNNHPKIQRILIDNECDTMDYGLEEIQNIEELGKENQYKNH